MNKQLSISLEVLAFFTGAWLFISNTLDSGSDERVLAGLGAGIVFLGFAIKEFRLKLSISQLSVLWKIIVLSFGVIGTWIFVTNTLDSGSDERVLAGLGGALILISLYIRDSKKEQDAEKSLSSGLNLKTALLFVVIFTFYGLHKKDIRSVNWDIRDIESDVQSLDRKVDDIEDYSHYH